MANLKTGVAIATAAAALFSMGMLSTSVQAADDGAVKCSGVNSCKGTSECKTASKRRAARSSSDTLISRSDEARQSERPPRVSPGGGTPMRQLPPGAFSSPLPSRHATSFDPGLRPGLAPRALP